MNKLNKGRRQNSLAAAAFNLYMRRYTLILNATTFCLQPANVDVSPYIINHMVYESDIPHTSGKTFF